MPEDVRVRVLAEGMPLGIGRGERGEVCKSKEVCSSTGCARHCKHRQLPGLRAAARAT